MSKSRFATFAPYVPYAYAGGQALAAMAKSAGDAYRAWYPAGGETKRSQRSSSGRPRARPKVIMRPRGSRFSRGGRTKASRSKAPRRGKARGRSSRFRKTGARTISIARKRAVRQVFSSLAPRNELITQSSGQIRTSGVGITGQGNQTITVLNTVVSPADILTIITQIAAQQGSSSGAGSLGFNNAAYGSVIMDRLQGKRTHHLYEFVNSGNQDVHFQVWWFKAKEDFMQTNTYTTLAQFIDYCTSTTLVSSISRGGLSYTGTYTNVTNPYHVLGWNPNMVRNFFFRKFFNIKVGPRTIIRPAGHHKVRVPLGKGARSFNIADWQLSQAAYAGAGQFICRKGDLIPVIVTYGDVVHGSNASTNTTVVSTGSVTLDYVRMGFHYWQAIPQIAPQQYFGGANLNQTTALGGGVTLADAVGAPAIYTADA